MSFAYFFLIQKKVFHPQGDKSFFFFNDVLAFTIWCEFLFMDFPGASIYNMGDPSSIPGSRRSPGEGNGNPLQYSCLENPMDRGAWQVTVSEVAKSWTQLSDFTFTFLCIGLFKLLF